MTTLAADTQPTTTDLIRHLRRTPGGMATTWDLANALDIPETEIAPLAARARDLGLITAERDPRTLSPMHRLTETGRGTRRTETTPARTFTVVEVNTPPVNQALIDARAKYFGTTITGGYTNPRTGRQVVSYLHCTHDGSDLKGVRAFPNSPDEG